MFRLEECECGEEHACCLQICEVLHDEKGCTIVFSGPRDSIRTNRNMTSCVILMENYAFSVD